MPYIRGHGPTFHTLYVANSISISTFISILPSEALQSLLHSQKRYLPVPREMLSVVKLAAKVKMLGDHKPCLCQGLLGSSHEPLTATPAGFLPVYVGDEQQRFVIPLRFLSHPLFRMLLEKAYREYGFKQRRGLFFPCTVSTFQEVVSAVECFHGQFNVEKLVDEFIEKLNWAFSMIVVEGVLVVTYCDLYKNSFIRPLIVKREDGSYSQVAGDV